MAKRGRPRKDIHRQRIALSVAPETIGVLKARREATGLSISKLIDAAVLAPLEAPPRKRDDDVLKLATALGERAETNAVAAAFATIQWMESERRADPTLPLVAALEHVVKSIADTGEVHALLAIRHAMRGALDKIKREEDEFADMEGVAVLRTGPITVDVPGIGPMEVTARREP